jgi:hypothetical protein
MSITASQGIRAAGLLKNFSEGFLPHNRQARRIKEHALSQARGCVTVLVGALPVRSASQADALYGQTSPVAGKGFPSPRRHSARGSQILAPRTQSALQGQPSRVPGAWVLDGNGVSPPVRCAQRTSSSARQNLSRWGSPTLTRAKATETAARTPSSPRCSPRGPRNARRGTDHDTDADS